MRDWKSLISLLATIAGVVIPVILWQWDLSSRSLVVHLKSISQLAPQPSELLPDLKIMASGQALLNPTLAVVRVENTGSKPIHASDFERPIVLSSQSGVQFNTFRILHNSPSDLRPQIVFSPESIAISPLLLNPKDSFEIELILSGNGLPKIEATARIAGIQKIDYIDDARSERNSRKMQASLVTAFILTAVYAAAFFRAIESSQTTYYSIRAVLLSALTGIAGALLAKPYFDNLSIISAEFLLPIAAAVTAGIFLQRIDRAYM